MKAELLAVGSELLGPLRAETNTLWLTERLLDAGVEVTARTTLADDLALIESAFRGALARADVVIATGGLGPTADDLTREGAAAATGRALQRDAALLETLRARFARFQRPMAPTNAQQADLIDGARPLPNARGTAPGQLLEHDGRLVVLLPGPPGEMKPMFDEQVLPRLREHAGAGRIVRRRVLKIAAMGESDVDQLAAPVYSRFDNPKTTILGAAGQVELHLVAHGDGEAEAERQHRGAGRGASRRAARPRLQRGRARAAGGRGPPAARPLAHDRPRRVLHGRSSRRTAHAGPRGERRPRARLRDLRQPREGRGAGRRRRAPRGPRRGVSGGGRGDGRGRAARGAGRRRDRRSPASPGPTAARRRSRSASSSSPPTAPPARACGAPSSPARASACGTRRPRSRSR